MNSKSSDEIFEELYTSDPNTMVVTDGTSLLFQVYFSYENINNSDCNTEWLPINKIYTAHIRVYKPESQDLYMDKSS